MNAESTPYEVVSTGDEPTLPLSVKLMAGFVGMLVFVGTACTLGMFLSGVLMMADVAPERLSVEASESSQSPPQRILFIGGGTISIGFSVWLGAFVASKILKSQQMVADVTRRRRELQEVVGQMHTAVKNQQRDPAFPKRGE